MNTKRQATDSITPKKTFLICTEGTKTEPEYFQMLNSFFRSVNIKCPIHKVSKNHPIAVLQQMKRKIKKFELQEIDQAWIVMDKNEWSKEQLNEPYEWSTESESFGFAVSNPNFEYWLLLHFEDAKDIGTDIDSVKKIIKKRLNHYIPKYNKSIDSRIFSIEKIENAVRRAKEKDLSPCIDWPKTVGQTTVYKLVQQIIET